MAFTAIVLGGTGMTGSLLLQQLLNDNDCTNVRALTRKPLALEHPKLESIVIDFNNENAFREAIRGDVLFCCIGTTIGKAGSKDAFRKVDYDIPVKAATFARANGVKQYLLISAVGAGISSASFYSRTKGEVERSVQQAGLFGVHIFRPSFLIGNREENRPTEKIAGVVWPVVSLFFWGRMKKWRGIKAATVASAMVSVAKRNEEGIHIYESDAIEAIGSRAKYAR